MELPGGAFMLAPVGTVNCAQAAGPVDAIRAATAAALAVCVKSIVVPSFEGWFLQWLTFFA
jgi:hypothetical protein